MALVPKLKSEDADDLGDITSNLETLQFESVFSEEETELLHLRKRTHAITVHACAQATYFVSVLNEARQIKSQLHNPNNKRASRLLQESSSRDPLLIGIIGCGRLGSHLAHSFLTFGEVNPEDIKISTRRPETLIELQEKGVVCVSNNLEVARSVHILFLCVLPSQFPTVAEELKTHLSPNCLIYSFLSSVPLTRHRQLLACSNIIKPDFQWEKNSHGVKWDYSVDVTGTFAKQEALRQTCPLYQHQEEPVVRTNPKFAEHLVYAFINACTFTRINRTHTLEILNAVMLGHTAKEPLEERIEQSDILREAPIDTKTFPKFDLCIMVDKETPLTQKLLTNSYIRQKFVDRYCSIFKVYLDWKSTAMQHAKRQMHFMD